MRHIGPRMAYTGLRHNIFIASSASTPSLDQSITHCELPSATWLISNSNHKKLSTSPRTHFSVPFLLCKNTSLGSAFGTVTISRWRLLIYLYDVSFRSCLPLATATTKPNGRIHL